MRSPAPLLPLILLALPTSAFAQFSIPWSTTDAGGGDVSGGPFALTGVIGQFDAGPVMSGGTYQLSGGFLPGAMSGPTGCNPADLGSQGGMPGPDHALDNNDFIVFINFFFTHDSRRPRHSGRPQRARRSVRQQRLHRVHRALLPGVLIAGGPVRSQHRLRGRCCYVRSQTISAPTASPGK
ncbi:MAG: hypothetical protein QM783_05490 [Phycisphaerales bacterium]